MRQLKYHEQKLLKKVDFLKWHREHNLRELQVRLSCNRCSGEAQEKLLILFMSRHIQSLSSYTTLWALNCTYHLVQVMRTYHIQDRDDYKKYNKLCGMVTRFVSAIKSLDVKDEARIELTDQLLDK